ncbi:hypothetical protein [Streptomyces shenzhenensis]|uniref:hypothetical protein n=1 Tax=Streptomyces shenzhenensis TaxID=943815 RepID=UPI0036928869
MSTVASGTTGQPARTAVRVAGPTGTVRRVRPTRPGRLACCPGRAVWLGWLAWRVRRCGG